MEIIQERLEREYDLDLITTAPTVVFEIVQKNGEIIYVDNPSKLPDLASIQEMREPICRATILVPKDHLGNVITLCIEKRGVQRDMHFLSGQVQVVYDLPMNEVVLDFFDRLKSTSRGYACLLYTSCAMITSSSESVTWLASQLGRLSGRGVPGRRWSMSAAAERA